MTKETSTALLGSIEKWEKIADGTGQDLGVKNCPLCQLYHDAYQGCRGCPVEHRTGEDFCISTPYTAWILHRRVVHPDGIVSECPQCLSIAREEINFLKSLLPENNERHYRG